MSDGPYRSLPMPPGWRRFAEFAENRNFDPVDVCNAAVGALEEDWRLHVPPSVVEGIRKAFLDPQADLFADQRGRSLEELVPQTAGHGLGRLLLDHAVAKVRTGAVGEDALAEVGESALLTRGSRGIRQVEEHYCREGAGAQAKDVRGRLEDGCRAAPLNSLARELLQIGPRLPRASLKHDDLDDGVALP